MVRVFSQAHRPNRPNLEDGGDLEDGAPSWFGYSHRPTGLPGGGGARAPLDLARAWARGRRAPGAGLGARHTLYTGTRSNFLALFACTFLGSCYSMGVGRTSPDSHGVNMLDRIEAWAHAHPRAAAIAFTLYLIVALLVCGTMDYNA